ncbi:unnamed protein product, partial [Ectocarpus sp. 13 AM-2016]
RHQDQPRLRLSRRVLPDLLRHRPRRQDHGGTSTQGQQEARHHLQVQPRHTHP